MYVLCNSFSSSEVVQDPSVPGSRTFWVPSDTEDGRYCAIGARMGSEGRVSWLSEDFLCVKGLLVCC